MSGIAAARERMRLIHLVAERAYGYSTGRGLEYTILEWVMDIDCADHCVPLDLARLAGAPEFDFIHDVFGIRRHLNRETKLLEDCFLPRYAILERNLEEFGGHNDKAR